MTVSYIPDCLLRAGTAGGDVITVRQGLIQRKLVAVKMASVSELYDVTWEGKEHFIFSNECVSVIFYASSERV